MIEKILKWSLDNRALVLALGGAMLLWGGWTAARMPVDVFPDLTAPTVTVMTEAAGMAPQEVESQVTFPIESALNGAPGVRRVRSSTAVGISVVWTEFDWGTDIYAARQVVAEKLQLAAQSLPPEAARPVMTPIASVMGEVMFLALDSDGHTPMEVRTEADWTVRRRLLSVPGVAQVTAIGGEEKQYQALLDPARMAARGVSVAEAAAALAGANRNASAGFIVAGAQEYLVRGVGRFTSTADMEETVVAVRGGQPVLLRHIGRAAIGPALKRGEGSLNGAPAVILSVQKQPGSNTLALTRDLDKALDDLQRTLPAGMRLERNIFRQADFIEVAVGNVVAALRDGAVLVLIVLLVFLGSARASGISMMAIPLSLVAAVLALKGAGATINTMTLGGLAIAIGALVDDAIIDVENVMRRLRQNAALAGGGKPALSVILSATLEIRPSIVFATLIIMLVFLPLFFLTGVEGRLMRPLGFAYVVALFASLIVALVITPAMCWYLLPGSRAMRRGGESRAVVWLKGVYRPALLWSMRRAALLAWVSAGLFAASAAGWFYLGRAFLPEFNEGALTVSAVTLPGTSLAESDSLGRAVEQVMLAQPEVAAVARRTGRAELDEHSMGVESAELDVRLEMKERSRAEFLSALRAALAAVPGVNIVIGQPISHRIDHMLSGTRASLAVKIFGPDLYELRRTAARVRDAAAGVPGIADLAVEQQSDIPALKVRFDRKAMAVHGLRAADIAPALEAAFKGLVVSRVLEGSNSFDLSLRYGRELQLHEAGDLLIDTPAGRRVPLKALAELSRESGPNSISRENAQRKIVVMANASGRAIGDVVGDVRRAVEAEVSLPAGYRIEYGGQFEAEAEASRVLAALGAAVVLGIGLLLWLAFRSYRDALFIMLNMPLALIGGVAGVILSGGTLSVASLIGFIALFGIAVRNGIMLISHIRHLHEKEGEADFTQAVLRGSMERLSPILMTALCAGLALVPLALGGDKPGSEIQTPMALVILSGLVTSTVLNMLVVPALYARLRAAAAD
ncbi:MAG: CzcA family heavy metal efflux protein [Elusimicrobia bacterium]|nr:MAG: CzcA family heavy metal efflux protein [Elusimicrobiota bacterium]KAF0153851.1 MAG: CzcA family heavy metal efflux protein [Elusimicrobiota bacterium]